MARDILGEFGPEYHGTREGLSHSGQTTDGGKPYCNPEPYSPPVGPREMMRERPGVGHVEPRYGMAGESLGEMPGQEFTGSPGNHGKNHGNKGTQGSY